MTHPLRILLLAVAVFSYQVAHAQRDARPDRAGTVQANVRVLRYNGSVDQRSGIAQVTFAVYDTDSALVPLWQETQSVELKDGRFSALIGASQTNGIPEELFAAEQARWLAISFNGEELSRQRLVAVPYAMKAMDADRLGGRTASEFLMRSELSSAFSAFVAGREVSGWDAIRPARTTRPDVDLIPGGGTSAIVIGADGFFHAVRNAPGETTILAEAAASGANSATGVTGTSNAGQGIGVRGDALAVSGINAGLMGTTASPSGYGALFNNHAGGKIAGFQSGGTEVAFVDSDGFHGSGANIINIPTSALVGTLPGAQVAGNIAGSATTAEALATNGSNCTAGQYARGIDASGNVEGCSTEGSLLVNLTPENIAPGTAAINISGNANFFGGLDSSSYAQIAYVDLREGIVVASLTSHIDTQISLEIAARTAADTALQTSLDAFSNAAIKNDQPNTYAPNTRQTFVAGTNTAGISLAGVTQNPSAAVDGDIWLRNDLGKIHFRANGVIKALASVDDISNGNAGSANALAANGTNCAVGSFAVGVDAAGNAEGCAPVTGTVSNIATGAGLTGGPITTTGTIGIATGGVSNAMLANNSIEIVAGNAMFGGGPVALGGSVTLHNAGVTSISGTPNEIETTANIGSVTVSLPPSGVKLPGRTKLTGSGSFFASLNMPSGIAPQVPESGDIWNESGLLRLQNGTETKAVVTASPTAFSVDIAPLGLTVNPHSCVLTGDFSVSVPNAAIGDPVVLSLPADWGAPPGPSFPASSQDLIAQGWVNAPGIVLIRVCNAGDIERILPQNVFISGRVLKF